MRRSLLAAVVFFDLFDYPLTLIELKRWRRAAPGEPASADLSLNEILEAVRTLPVQVTEGYYHLPGRASTVATRKKRYRWAEKKYARAARLAGLLRWLPSVRLVAVCNSLAISNAGEKSDIDLFLVCRTRSLWITRLLVAGALHLFRLRPEPGREADRFCLSFMVAEDWLDLETLALASGDSYLRYWVASLVPLYDAGGVMAAFTAANEWVRTELPGAEPVFPAHRRSIGPRRGFGWLLPLLRRVDGWAKRRQLKWFPPHIREQANLDSRVVIADHILKFHVDDRRARYEQQFRERLAEAVKKL